MYDFCGLDAPAAGDRPDTHWAFVYRFNAIFYTVVTGMVICSCTGLIYTRIFNATLNCLILAMFVHVAAIVLAGVFRFSTEGKSCADNVEVYDSIGNSWGSDATLFKKLFIA